MEEIILKKVADYYTDKVKTHGLTPQGADWKNKETQDFRFQLLCQLFDGFSDFDVNDLGCGYGSLVTYMRETGLKFRKYYGYDISEEMIKQGLIVHAGAGDCELIQGKTPDRRQFTVASGILNVKLDTPVETWRATVLEMLNTLYQASSVGFSFNMLNLPTDEIYRRDHLFYADPIVYEELCKKRFGSDVKILFHEQLYEFTVLVKACTIEKIEQEIDSNHFKSAARKQCQYHSTSPTPLVKR